MHWSYIYFFKYENKFIFQVFTFFSFFFFFVLVLLIILQYILASHSPFNPLLDAIFTYVRLPTDGAHSY